MISIARDAFAVTMGGAKVSAGNEANCIEHVWERDELYRPLGGEIASMCLRCGVVKFEPADHDHGPPVADSSSR